MKCSQGVLSSQVSPGGHFALAVPVCWCLLLPLLSVIVGMPLITIRSWSQALLGCFQRDKFLSWSQTSHFQGGRDTGLRGGEVQGDEVHTLLQPQRFSKSPAPSGGNIQLEKSLNLDWRGRIPACQPWGWEAPGKEILKVERTVLHFRGPF